MQHGEKDGTFHREAEATPRQALVQHGGAASVTPQALEDQRRADTPAAKLRDAIHVSQREHHGALCLAGGRAGETIKIAARGDVLLAPEIGDDTLPDLALVARRLNQIDIGVGTDALFPHEHGALAFPKRQVSQENKGSPRII
jgi:hypothetical protein